MSAWISVPTLSPKALGEVKMDGSISLQVHLGLVHKMFNFFLENDHQECAFYPLGMSLAPLLESVSLVRLS